MNYGEIKKCDIADGLGVRVSLFVSGCRRHCKNCQNEVAWDFKYGEHFDKETMQDILNHLEPSYIRGLTILGGEPFEPENIGTVLNICELVKRQFPEKDIWIYTGFCYEDIIKRVPNLSIYADVLIDGPYIEELRDISLRFRGSKNQRIIDLKKSTPNHVVNWYLPSEHDPKENMESLI